MIQIHAKSIDNDGSREWVIFEHGKFSQPIAILPDLAMQRFVKEIQPEIQEELEATWSDVLGLLQPHRQGDESIYQTAERMIPPPSNAKVLTPDEGGL